MPAEKSRTDSIRSILKTAQNEGRTTLLEAEGLDILALCGVEVPRAIHFHDASEITELSYPLFSTNPKTAAPKVVLKAASPDILHKTEMGAVTVIANTKEAVLEAFRAMQPRLASHESGSSAQNPVRYFTLNEFIPHSPFVGEFLLSLKLTDDFGPVATLSAGGVHAEFLAKHLSSSTETAVFSPQFETTFAQSLRSLAWAKLTTRSQRGQPPFISEEKLLETIRAFMRGIAPLCESGALSEFEINPLVITETPTKEKKLVALDALVKLKQDSPNKSKIAALPRPIEKIRHLLTPERIAIMGVSEKMNPGRVILQNTLRCGFSPEHITVIKPQCAPTLKIDDCACVPDIRSLPEAVDLLVVSVSAEQVPGVIQEVCETRKAHSLIVIPGGLEEKAGTSHIVEPMKKALRDSRSTAWKGPVINGGNCLGITSDPGKYNTVFIPTHKISVTRDVPVLPLALISQSGAFGIARMDQLGTMQPRYSLSIGNQMDLTAGDYLHYLKSDPEVRVFGVYLEGFRPGDGIHFLKAAEEIVRSGRTVILYRSGRTLEGATASASHTASIAGDYAITRSLCAAHGILMADTLEEFEDLTSLFTLLSDRPARGMRIGAATNAGFECVAIGDRLKSLKLAKLSPDTERRLQEVLAHNKLAGIVDVHHPMDITPMGNDSACAQVFETLLSDSEVDVGVLGAVPLTPALHTLETENITSDESIVMRLVALRKTHPKPFVVVVDAGSLYEPMSRRLKLNRVPVFPHMDRALRALNAFCQHSKGQRTD